MTNKTMVLRWTPIDEDVRTGPMVDVLYEVADERERQVAKWGEQHHPDGTGGWSPWDHQFGGGGAMSWDAVAYWAKLACDSNHAAGEDDWCSILTEEFAEAMAETDRAKLRAELVQVAAVCCAWVEDLDSRGADG